MAKPLSRNYADNEKNRFKEDSNGDVAVNICGQQLQDLIDLLTANSLIWTRTIVVIPAGQTLVVDNNLLNSFSRLKYILNFKGDTSGETKGLELTVQNNNGSLDDVVTTRLGGSLNTNINVTDDSIDMFLEITNNESEDLTLSFIKNIL